MDGKSDDPPAIFTPHDLCVLFNAVMQAQSKPFCLFIQGASPASEVAWLESVYALPDAKVNR